MSKLSSFCRLLAWFWNHSDRFMPLLDALQDRLPLVVEALRWSAGGLDRLTSLENQIVTTIKDAELPLRSVPSPDLHSRGLGDALSDALPKFGLGILAPSNDQKNEMNRIRLPEVSFLSTGLFPILSTEWCNRANDLANKIRASDNPIAKSAKALRDIADLLESTQNP